MARNTVLIRTGEDVVRVRQGSLVEGAPDEPFDLVLANITIRTLLELEPLLALQAPCIVLIWDSRSRISRTEWTA